MAGKSSPMEKAGRAELAELVERTEHLNAVLRAVRHINRLIVREKDVDDLVKSGCDILMQTRGFYGAWIVLTPNKERSIVAAHSGFPDPAFAELLEEFRRGNPPPCCHQATTASRGAVTIDRSVTCESCPLGGCHQGTYELVSMMAYQGRCHGFLGVCVPRRLDDEEEIGLLREIAGDLAFALHGLELEKARRESEHVLKQRVKEQTCLYAVSRLVQRVDATVREILEVVPDLIPQGWQYPESAVARIRLGDLQFSTADFRETDWMLRGEISADGAKVGSIDVCYLEAKPPANDGPFLREERTLLDAICGLLGDFVERHSSAQRVRESEEQFRVYFEESLVGMAITSPEKGWIEANTALLGMLGYTDEEIRRTTWADLTHPEDLQADLDQFNHLLAGEIDGYRMEKRFLRRDGGVVDTLLSVKGVRQPDGSVDYVLAQIEDISNLKRAEEALAYEQKQSIALFDGIEDVLYVSDPETYDLLYVNQSFRDQWGHDVIGQKCYRVLQNRTEPCPFCTNDKIFGEYLGTSYVWEFCNEVTRHWYRCADKAIRWADGRLVRFEIAADITDRKVMEEDLRLRERQLAVRAGIAEAFLTNSDDQAYGEALEVILNAMQSPYGVLGYMDEEEAFVCPSLTRNVWHRCEVPGKDVRFPPESLRRQPHWSAALYRREVVLVNEPVEVPSGHVPIERLLIVPMVHGDSTVGGLAVANRPGDYGASDVEVLTNIASAAAPIVRARSILRREEAARRLAENRLRTANEELARSNRELEQFAYVASHDLQEPLRMVSSYTQLLAESYGDRLDDRGKKFIDYAVDGASRMQCLIQDLLSYSRVTTRGSAFQLVDTHDALGRALANLHMAIRESGAVITTDELPPVNADLTQLTQVFQNLVGNAIKFQDDNPPRIHISSRPEGDHWVFSVKDNGIGIDVKYRDKVFTIFQRLHPRGRYPGTGMGLAMCKRIVERHGGSIGFESEPGKGATFYFTVPREAEEAVTDEARVSGDGD